MLTAGTSYIASETLFEGLAEVLWKEVDEGWVRYDPSAGETLLLAPITRFVLDQLTVPGRHLTGQHLVRAILHEEPDAAPEDCQRLVAIALDALVKAHLIRVESSPALENP